MNYSLIRPCDIANGPGVRVSLFVSGCTHHCSGCFQPETWNFDYGQPFTYEVEQKIFSMLRPDYIDGLTILGGEPLEPSNQRDLLPFVETVNRGLPNKPIWVYTGFVFEELKGRTGEYGAVTKSLLSQIDILVDGPFIEAKKDLRLKFCGSSNQRLIDLRKTATAGQIVLWEDCDNTDSEVCSSMT